MLPDVLSFARGPKGELISVARTLDRVVIFNSTGALLHSVGEKGTARGQFMRASKVIATPGGHFVVRDFQLGTATVLDSAFTAIRTASAPYSVDLALPSGGYISGQQIRTPGRVGYPLHLLNTDFDVVRSFGVDTPEFRSDMPRMMNRLVTLGTGGTVWSVAPGRYEFEEWNPISGQRLRRFAVTSEWFVESLRAQPLENIRVRPSSVVESIWHDGTVLWAMTRVADTNWTPRPGPATERPFDVTAYDGTFDWMLEAIDPTDGRLLASRRLRDAHWGDPASRLLSTRVPSSQRDSTSVNILAVRLEVPRR
jgi:hypothetical protein